MQGSDSAVEALAGAVSGLARLRNRDHRRSQQSVADQIARLHDIHHGPGLCVRGRHFGDGLMQVRIEALASMGFTP